MGLWNLYLGPFCRLTEAKLEMITMSSKTLHFNIVSVVQDKHVRAFVVTDESFLHSPLGLHLLSIFPFQLKKI